MWISEKTSADNEPKKFWGEINGVRLTRVDEEEQYLNETLSTVIKAAHSGRHFARIAHLYFARTPTLSQADLETNLLTLFEKVFGPSPMKNTERGWLGASYSPDLPKNVWSEICRDLDSTFDINKWESEQLKVFRVVQLLHPKEKENLFHVVYRRKNISFQYFYPICDLPPRTERILRIWRQGQYQVYVPELYIELCGGHPPVVENYLQLYLSDLFTMRFLNWFTGSCHLNHQTSANSQIKKKKKGSLFSTVPDALAGNPPLEILFAYMQVFLTFSSGAQESIPLRSQAIFRWAICDLWLNRIKMNSDDPPVSPVTKLLLNSIYILICHITLDRCLVFDDEITGEIKLSVNLNTFRYPLYNFFVCTFQETPCDSEPNNFDSIIDLWLTYLTPWKTQDRVNPAKEETSFERIVHFSPLLKASSHPDAFDRRWIWFIVHNYCIYVDLFLKIVEHLDQEANPSLEVLEAFLRCFGPNSAFSLQSIGILLTCESLLKKERLRLPHCIEISSSTMEIVEFVQNNEESVISVLRQQNDTCDLVNLRPFLSANLKSFIRELVHKRKLKPSPHISTFTLIQNEKKDDNITFLSNVFNIHLDSLEVEGRRPESTSGPFALPETEFKRDILPKWMRDVRTSHKIGFKALTDLGKRQLRNGLREGNAELAIQYLGDPSKRPPELYEIPSLVELSKYLDDFLHSRLSSYTPHLLRPIADSRNLMWGLILWSLFDYFKNNGENSKWIVSLVFFVCGGAVLRGFALKFWHLTFFSVWLYMLLAR